MLLQSPFFVQRTVRTLLSKELRTKRAGAGFFILLLVDLIQKKVEYLKNCVGLHGFSQNGHLVISTIVQPAEMGRANYDILLVFMDIQKKVEDLKIVWA